MDFLRTAKTRVRCGQATLNLQPEPQAVGDPLLLPVLILPRNDRGEGVRPVEFKVQLGTASQGGAEVLSPTATRATATTNDTHTRKDGCERGRRRSTNCTFEPGATRLHRPRVSFVRESPGGIACCRTPYRHARRQTIEAKVLSQEPRDATCHRYPSRWTAPRRSHRAFQEPTQRTNRFGEEKGWRFAHVRRLLTVERTLGARRLPGLEDQSHPGEVTGRRWCRSPSLI